MLVKRSYLPLIAIYFIDDVGLSIKEIGLFAGIAGAIRLGLEIPSGYFSDKVSRVWIYRGVGVLQILALSSIILFPNYLGVLVYVILDSISNSFYSGTGQALVNECLHVLGREEDTAKVLSKTQSKSLLVNAVLISLVPMTYALNPRMPFMLGAIQFLLLIVVALQMRDIRNPAANKVEKLSKDWAANHKGYLSFAVLLGLFAALCTTPSDFRNLVHQANGIPPEYFGWMFAGASLIASFVGVWIHRLKNLGIHKFMIIDSFSIVLSLALFIPASPVLGITGFISSMVWWRYRGTYIQILY